MKQRKFVQVQKFLWVAAGGAAGAMARDGLRSLAGPEGTALLPQITLGINVFGSFLLGFLLILFIRTVRVPAPVRMGLTTGFLGGFTTFSTFCKESVGLVQTAGWAGAFWYTAGSVGLGLLAAFVGVRAGQLLERRARP